MRLAGPVVRVTLDEYAITPQDLSVPSGRVELVARNAGRLTHNLRVEVPPKEPGDQTMPLGGTPTSDTAPAKAPAAAPAAGTRAPDSGARAPQR